MAAACAIAGCGPQPDAVGPALSDFLAGHGREVVVERVLDGDTIVVSGDERVRLLTIDAPELNSRSADPPECGAEASRDALAELLPVGTAVVLNGLKGEPTNDRYGRTLSNVYLVDDGATVNVSLHQVTDGWAMSYTDYPTSDSPDADLAETQARNAGRGIWRMCS